MSCETMKAGFLPHMEVCHTSKSKRGQIYVPTVNTIRESPLYRRWTWDRTTVQWVRVSVEAPELRDASRQFDIPGSGLPSLSLMQHSTLQVLWQLFIQFSSTSECCQARTIWILVLSNSRGCCAFTLQGLTCTVGVVWSLQPLAPPRTWPTPTACRSQRPCSSRPS
jgi:hypothetical protein